MKKILVVGAGLSGSVVANTLASHGFSVDVIENRSHLGGNLYTEKDIETGIIKHVYGPHIFNTNKKAIWDFVNQYIPMTAFINRVKVNFNSEIYSFPINLHTLNQFFKRAFSPNEARDFIDSIRDKSIVNPENFEEQAMAMVGSEIYEAFLRDYTVKQWGVHPRELPASILARLPLRFDYNDNYYNKKFQGIPELGYTPLFEKLLDHSDITVFLGEKFSRVLEKEYSHTFYSGTIDGYFEKEFGSLGYRTVFWESFIEEGDYQGNAVINYPNLDLPYTRMIEHKHFYPELSFAKTIVSREFSKETLDGDEPYYPKRLSRDKERLALYLNKAEELETVTFMGRLGTYRYIDMDSTIEEALHIANSFVEKGLEK